MPPPSTPAPPLKIKLTVPPGLFARPVPAASTSSSVISPQKKTTKSTISPYANKAPHPPPRKRGRPPKALAAAYAAQAAKKSSQVAAIKKASSTSSIKGKGKAPAAKKAVVASGNAVKGGRNARRRLQIASDDDYNPQRAGPSTLKRTHSTIDYSDDDEEDAERHPPETGIKGSSSKYVYFTSFWLFVSLAAGFSPQCADLGRLLEICYNHVLSCISRDRLAVRHANPF